MKKYFYLLANGDPKIGSAVEEMVSDFNGFKYAVLARHKDSGDFNLSLIQSGVPLSSYDLTKHLILSHDCAALDLNKLFDMDYEHCMLCDTIISKS